MFMYQSEGYKGVENKSDLKRTFDRCNYSVGNSKEDNNKVCIFNAKLVDKSLLLRFPK